MVSTIIETRMNDLKDIELEQSGWEDVGVLVPDETGTKVPYMEEETKFKVLALFNNHDTESSYFGGYHGTAEENTKGLSFYKKYENDSFWEWLDDFYKRADALIHVIKKHEITRFNNDNPYFSNLHYLAMTKEYAIQGRLLLEEYGEPTYFSFDIARNGFLWFDTCIEGPVDKDGITLIKKELPRNPKASIEERKRIAKDCFEREIKRAKGEYASGLKYGREEYDKVINTMKESSFKEFYIVSLCGYFEGKLLKENMVTKSLSDFTFEDYYHCNKKKTYYRIVKE